MLIFVPTFTFDWISNPKPSLLHSFFFFFCPIPVLFPNFPPFSPVNPFSNTLSKSLSIIPTPSSAIVNTTVFDISFDAICILSSFPLEYFMEFIRIWFIINSIHLLWITLRFCNIY